MKKNNLFFWVMLSLIILLTACHFPRPKDEAVSPEAAAQTAAVKTVEALGTLVASTKPPAPPPGDQPTISQQPTVTQSLLASSTPTLNPPLPANTPFSMPSIPCDRAQFVTDVTVPDGSTYAPGQTFTKTWRLRNNGSCTWSTGYKLVFDSGEGMGGSTTIPLTASVAPGGEINVSVSLTSPSTPNSYQGFWKLENAAGARFGIGQNANVAFWVKISVTTSGDSPSYFAVTSVNSSASPSSYNGACPATITFSAGIVTSAAGTVTYFWERSDGTKSSTESITFDSAGTKTITDTWTLGGSGFSYSGWEKIYIDQPNHQYFSPANFSMTCNP